jgi:hypothetical protein
MRHSVFFSRSVSRLFPVALPVAFLFGACVVRSYDQPPANPNTANTGTPAATPTPAATETAATPTTGTVAAAPPATTATPGPTSGLINPNLVKKMPEMKKANTFGQAQPFKGSIPGIVYALPANTTNLPTSWASLQSVATLHSSAWNISARDFKEGFPGVPADRTEWFAIRWEGPITIAKAGTYNFRMTSDDGARLSIDDVLIVNNDGIHPPKDAQGSSTLNAGQHKLVIEYFQGPAWQIALQVFVKSSTMPERVLTTSF